MLFRGSHNYTEVIVVSVLKLLLKSYTLCSKPH